MNNYFLSFFKSNKINYEKKLFTIIFCISFLSTPLVFADPPSSSIDYEPPVILLPNDIYITSSGPTPVPFTVKGFDKVDGKVSVNCDKISGQIFKTGKTTVRCESIDSAGNRAQSSFVITIGYEIVQIPSWVKNVTKLWVSNSIDDGTYSETIRYLIKEKIVKVPTIGISEYYEIETPIWIKNNAQYWVDGKISDDEYSIMLQWMIKRGLIKS